MRLLWLVYRRLLAGREREPAGEHERGGAPGWQEGQGCAPACIPSALRLSSVIGLLSLPSLHASISRLCCWAWAARHLILRPHPPPDKLCFLKTRSCQAQPNNQTKPEVLHCWKPLYPHGCLFHSPGGAARGKGNKGKRYGAGPATTDAALMEKLGDTIAGMRADFIVVHLQEPCSFCRAYISDAPRCAPPCLEGCMRN